jgi:uncharacterized tellurite resistance protein B-like protein
MPEKNQPLDNRIQEAIASRPVHTITKPSDANSNDEFPFGRAKFGTVVLMVELARCDGYFHEDERRTILDNLKRGFSFTQDQAEGLVQLAEDEILEFWDDQWDNGTFREGIVEDFSRKERAELVEMLWEVAYADGTVNPQETSFMWKMADGIGVSAPTTQRAQQRVAYRLSQEDRPAN